MNSSQPISVLLIRGPVGVGKTSVAFTISDILKRKSVPHVIIDLDSLREAYPRPKDDPFHMMLGYKNLHAIWENYKELGVAHLVIPNVVENADDLESIRTAIPGANIKVIRLRATLETIRQRLKGRDTGESLRWHLHRAKELVDQLELVPIGDFVIDTDQKNLHDVAQEILVKSHWLL